MKAGKEHRVPLCPRALAILEAIHPHQADGDAVSSPVANRKSRSLVWFFLMLLRRMKLGPLTAQSLGFRATFENLGDRANELPTRGC